MQQKKARKGKRSKKGKSFKFDLKIELYSLRSLNLGYRSQVTSVQKLSLEEMILLQSTWTSPGNLEIVHLF